MASRRISVKECPHVGGATAVTTTEKPQCERCAVRDHLRLCISCGGVFCCESDNAHNREHFEETGHPIIVSHGPLPYRFTWCWACNAYLEKQQDMSF